MPPKKKCEGKSAGAIIRRGEKILLIDRAFFPLGWACPAGHVKVGETPLEGIRRESKEETGLVIIKPRILLRRKHVKNKCVKGSAFHDWWVFGGYARGKLKRSKRETKAIGWFSQQEIKKMKLEPIWKRWLTVLGII